jgi:hypothetical protein
MFFFTFKTPKTTNLSSGIIFRADDLKLLKNARAWVWLYRPAHGLLIHGAKRRACRPTNTSLVSFLYFFLNFKRKMHYLCIFFSKKNALCFN